jgi:TPR repeat protein
LTAAHEQIGELKSKVNSPPERVRGTAEQTEERAAALKEAGVARLLSKAEELIRRGDVSGARLLLERALETGSHEAAFYLAQTFDPRFLHSWNVQGISPDPEKARALYNRAHEAGLTRAKALADAVH